MTKEVILCIEQLAKAEKQPVIKNRCPDFEQNTLGFTYAYPNVDNEEEEYVETDNYGKNGMDNEDHESDVEEAENPIENADIDMESDADVEEEQHDPQMAEEPPPMDDTAIVSNKENNTTDDSDNDNVSAEEKS